MKGMVREEDLEVGCLGNLKGIDVKGGKGRGGGGLRGEMRGWWDWVEEVGK